MPEATIFVSESGTAGVAPDGPAVKPGGPLSYVHWGPVIAGAIVASAAFFVLMTFAIALGLAVASAAPTWRDESTGLVVLSAAWVVLVAVGSYALGGYIAGRVRSTWNTTADEIHFRDGVHGLLVWGLAVVIGAALAWGTASLATISTAATNTAHSGAGAPAASTESFMPFELDRLFRTDRRPDTGDNTEARAEAGRILQSGLGHKDIASDDRAYLTRLVAARTGLSAPDAERRVQQIVAETRDAAAKARRSAVILGFTLAAALVAAAAAAWGAAVIGGRHRDQDIAPPMRFSWAPPPRVRAPAE
jgi:hypothetical protein